METGSENKIIYIAPVLFVISVYAFPILFFKLSDGKSKGVWDGSMLPILLIPVIFGFINLIVVLCSYRNIGREQLLNCVMVIKYTLIPFYIFGGLCIALAILLIFTPVVIMVFVGPAIAVTFSIMGWVVLLCGSPYSLAYIIKAGKEGVHPAPLSVMAAICQFIFTLDVISMMILAFREGKWRKLTLILFAAFSLAIFIVVIFVVLRIIIG